MPTESENPAMADPKPRDSSASPQGTDSTASRSESENPALKAPPPTRTSGRAATATGGRTRSTCRSSHRTSRESDPLGDDDFDYKKAVAQLDFEAVKADIVAVMRTSQDWWPADWGHYGPLFIRMSWHAAGTYRQPTAAAAAARATSASPRSTAGRTTATSTRPAACCLPVKQKYGRKLSLGRPAGARGQRRPRGHGLPTFGFAFGRADVWQPEEVFWGPEDTWLGDERTAARTRSSSEGALGAVTMGLIYVNPEGPKGADPAPRPTTSG